MIRRPIQVLAVFSVLALAVAGCGTSTTSAPATAAAPSSALELACAPTGDPGTVAVAIKDFEFSPAAITAKVGDVITFTNEGDATHTATLDGRDCGTERLSAGASGGLTFSEAGSYPFHCAIHSTMTGTIEVS